MVEVATKAGEADQEFMRLALFHAARGLGRTSPNPVVGCVVVSPGGVVVGTGHHERAGEAHAEVRALDAAGDRARGATLYCTLEPCSHRGRTGPCAPAVAAAGVARVVTATEDPNPRVRGRGVAYLRAHGVAVSTGVGAAAAARLNAPFFTAMTLGRPHVTLKAATSLDGRVAAAPGVRTVLSGPGSARYVQRLRAGLDAIAVGSGTVLADDPLLTVREVYRERPFLRVLLDRRLRTPPRARVFGTLAAGPVLVATTEASCAAQPAAVAALRAAGAEIVATPGGTWREVLAVLGAREIRSVLLEGGPSLQRAAWAAGLVDRIVVIVTPHVLGPAGVPFDVPVDLAGLITGVEPRGADVVLVGDVHRTH
jgi:diaminohydroxyphosphoribosylaminopyrimidine deaminase/5-amino-6-(5-phosphoribosylamino)uracil reductase